MSWLRRKLDRAGIGWRAFGRHRRWGAPIPLRQPFLFYVGHLPAFAWNHLWRRVASRPAFAPELDTLFERGIDPPDDGEGPTNEAEAWPSLDDAPLPAGYWL